MASSTTTTPEIAADPRFSGEVWQNYERVRRKYEEFHKAFKVIKSFPNTPSPPTPPKLPFPTHLEEFTPSQPPDSPTNKLIRDFRSFDQEMLEIGLHFQTLKRNASEHKNTPGPTLKNIYSKITQTKHKRNRLRKTMDKVVNKIINADHLSVISFHEFDFAQEMSDYKTKSRVLGDTSEDHVKEIRLRQEEGRFVLFEGTDGEEGRKNYENYDPSTAPRSKGWFMAYHDSKNEDVELELKSLERELKKAKMEFKEARERLADLRKARKRARAELEVEEKEDSVEEEDD